MNKCLVTKLNGSSNNSELLRLGEMRIKILKVQNPTDHTQGFSLGFNKPVTLEIVSDGYFTDKTLTENKGKKITLDAGLNSIWVNGTHDVEIAILDKYSLTQILFYYIGEASDTYANNIKFNIADLKYSNALTNISMDGSQVSGNIGDLKSLTALTTLSLFNSQVSGNIGDLKSLTALTKLFLSNAQIPITGDIGVLSVMSKCEEMTLQYGRFTGDLATTPALCRFISFTHDKGSVLTWSTRPSTARIIAMEGEASLTNIDKMLQDQAQCQVGFSSSDYPQYKVISIAGNRTSASDAAVETLQQKGYTVSITKA